MSSLQLVLARHGHCASLEVADDDPIVPDDRNHLTDRGKRQAETLARHVQQHWPTATLICSPLPRARQTAAPIEAALGVTATVDPRTAERNLGLPDTTTAAEARAAQLADLSNLEARRAGGESIADHHARVGEWLAVVREEATRDQVVVLVAHGGTLDLLQLQLSGAPLSAAQRFFVRCRPAHYHLWTFVRASPTLSAWRLDGVDLDPGA
ncbi:MAG: histidine phosphatase family protein [Myxococcota bacterium]